MKEFIIKKGKHSSGIHLVLNPHFGISSIERDVMFTESCLYEPLTRDYKDDINKLFGFSLGYHLKDSARYGWKPELNENNKLTGNIEIYSFVHDNWDFKFEYIRNVSINRKYTFSIKTSKVLATNFYDFDIYSTFENTTRHLGGDWKQVNEPKIPFGYLLYPWFGGQEVAQHDTIINMNKPIIR